MKIYLDAGHGGHDPGAVANGLREKDLTLDIAKRIRRILETEYTGVQVRLTRETDTYLDLSQRARMANQWGADFFLSIHVNAGGGTGFESFVYTKASKKSIEYQNIIHNEIVKILDVVDRGKKSENLAVLRETNMPAILTENLFIDNVTDAALLKDKNFIEKIAIGHAVGIANALSLQKKTKETPNKLYRLQTGTFSSFESAKAAKQKLNELFPNWTIYILEENKK